MYKKMKKNSIGSGEENGKRQTSSENRKKRRVIETGGEKRKKNNLEVFPWKLTYAQTFVNLRLLNQK